MTRKVYTVSRLNQEVQSLLESSFGTLWLEGELSNVSRPGSGHFYFTLKDSRAQIRCAMFKGRNRYVDFDPQSGDAVVVRGKLGLYAARGDFQLIVEHMEPAGEGRLQAAFEATKRKLDAQGWFDTAHKQPLPVLPQTIGIVTSPTGAALRDALQVLARRFRQADIIIYPTPTQGAAAIPGIVKAIEVANHRREADVLLLVRGGGSLEDLWAFNEVAVASAIRKSRLAIVAGIGHEVDVTISDLVADVRAPTPSAAAELATPDSAVLERRLDNSTRQLKQHHVNFLNMLMQRLKQFDTRLQLRHPSRRLSEQAQRVDELVANLTREVKNKLNNHVNQSERLDSRLRSASPAYTIQSLQSVCRESDQRLKNTIRAKHNSARSRFEILARTLNGVSPLAVLDRGYALIKKGELYVNDARQLTPGDEISARVSNGEVTATVNACQINDGAKDELKKTR